MGMWMGVRVVSGIVKGSTILTVCGGKVCRRGASGRRGVKGERSMPSCALCGCAMCGWCLEDSGSKTCILCLVVGSVQEQCRRSVEYLVWGAVCGDSHQLQHICRSCKASLVIAGILKGECGFRRLVCGWKGLVGVQPLMVLIDGVDLWISCILSGIQVGQQVLGQQVGAPVVIGIAKEALQIVGLVWVEQRRARRRIVGGIVGECVYSHMSASRPKHRHVLSCDKAFKALTPKRIGPRRTIVGSHHGWC